MVYLVIGSILIEIVVVNQLCLLSILGKVVSGQITFLMFKNSRQTLINFHLRSDCLVVYSIVHVSSHIK